MFRLIVLALLSLSTLDAQAPGELATLSWMTGHWAGQIGKAQSEEHWIAPVGNLMLGVSRTAVGQRVAAFEFLRVEKRADGIYYVAQPGGRPPTDFKLTKSTANQAVFENPKHDHPKVISYELADADTLVATVEGDEGGRHKREEFRFQRMPCMK